MFTYPYIEAVIIEQKNKKVDELLALGDLLWLIGICFFLKNVAGNIQEFFFLEDCVKNLGCPFSHRQFYEPCAV